MNVYISGPMTGIPEYNFPAFEAAFVKVSNSLGITDSIMSPHNFDNAEDPEKLKTMKWEDYLRRDLNVFTSAEIDRIYLLPGWQQSRGARLEVQVGVALGATLWDVETLEKLPPETILEEAMRLTSVDRQSEYGHPYDDFNRTAALWNALFEKNLKAPFSGADVPLAMVAVKLSREVNKPKRDNLVDGCGYLRTRGMYFEEELRRIKSGMLDEMKLAV